MSEIKIPDFLNIGIQKNPNKAIGYSQRIPVIARIIALVCAFGIMLACVIYIYNAFYISSSMHEENVDLILESQIGNSQTIVTHEPGYNVVKVIGERTEYYIFDEKNNLIYPSIVRRSTIEKLRTKDNKGIYYNK